MTRASLLRSLLRAQRGGSLAVNAPGGAVAASGCAFRNDTAVTGGSLFLNGSATSAGQLNLSASLISGSTAAAVTPHGGGVAAFFARVTLQGTTVEACSSTVQTAVLGPFTKQVDLSPFGTGAGGGLFLYSASLAILNGSLFASNNASNGAGVFITGNGSSVIVSASAFVGNRAVETFGGALHALSVPSVSLAAGTVLRDNFARLDGGALHLAGVGATALAGVQAAGNRADRGAVFFLDENCTAVAVASSRFDGNQAVAGAVGFLSGWAATHPQVPAGAAPGEQRNETLTSISGGQQPAASGGSPSAAAPPACDDCMLSNNTGAAWGDALFATDVAAAFVSVEPPVISSGAQVQATLTLFDGAPPPVIPVPCVAVTSMRLQIAQRLGQPV